MSRLSTCSALALLCTLAACDSSVERDDGSGGAGGDATNTAAPANGPSATSTSTTTTTAGATTGGSTSGGAPSSSSSGTPGLTACEEFCTEVPECGSDPCVESCLATRPEECGAEFDAFVSCRAQLLGSDCGDESICPEEGAAFEACLETASPTECFTTEGEGNGESCAAWGPCINGAEGHMSCEATDDGTAFCECYVDEVFLGTCTDPEVTCLLDVSCCGQFY